MKRQWRSAWGVLVLMAAVVALAGCSGAGTVPGALSTQELAETHMTTVQLLRGWLGIMYPPDAGPPPGQLDMHRERVSPDTWHIWGTDSYGHGFDYYSRTDQSGYGSWCEPSGMAVNGTWGPAVWTPNPRTSTQHSVYNYPGMTMEFDAVSIFPAGTGMAWTSHTGTVTLTDGRALQFRRENDAVAQESLHLTLAAAGIDVELHVPVGFVVNRGWRPLPGQPATGTAQTADGPMSLSLQGVDGDWQQWDFTGPDGTTGSFTLGGNMSGSGRLTRGGSLLGVLNWPDSLVGRLDLLSLNAVEVTPAAAARDLAIEQWVSSLAGLGPGGIR